MQERLAAIDARLDVTESETARLAAERLSLEDERRELERRMSSTSPRSRRTSLVAVIKGQIGERACLAASVAALCAASLSTKACQRRPVRRLRSRPDRRCRK
jgi:hypothetical protein